MSAWRETPQDRSQPDESDGAVFAEQRRVPQLLPSRLERRDEAVKVKMLHGAHRPLVEAHVRRVAAGELRAHARHFLNEVEIGGTEGFDAFDIALPRNHENVGRRARAPIAEDDDVVVLVEHAF